MALARWQANIVDDAGNVIPGAQVTVRREEVASPLAVLFTDRDGTVPAGNPVAADPDGYVFFHVAGGAYRIDAVAGAFSRTWRYVAIGAAAESDSLSTGIRYRFSASVTDADPGDGLLKFNNATPGSASQIFIDDLSTDGVDMTAVIATFDDGGSSAARGLLTIEQSGAAAAFFVGQVTGSVTTASGYRKITVTPLASAGTFVADAVLSISFSRAGTDGEVSGPDSPAPTVGELVRFDDTSGKRIGGTGVTIVTVGAGKSSIFIAKGGLTPRTVGPSAGVLAVGSTEFDYWAFDPSTNEDLRFCIGMPKGWNESTITYKLYWAHPATVTNFATLWNLFVEAYSNDDAIDGVTFGSQQVADTGGTTSDMYISPESAAITVGNSPAEGDILAFILRREATNIADTLGVDAYLIAIMVHITYNANTDA